MKNNNIIKFITLQLSFIIFSLSSLFVKFASCSKMFSSKFFIYFSISIILLGVYALLWQRILKENKLPITKGCIFHGPPGCGKTTLVKAVANEMKLPLYSKRLDAPVYFFKPFLPSAIYSRFRKKRQHFGKTTSLQVQNDR